MFTAPAIRTSSSSAEQEEESCIGFANGESANATHALFPRHLTYILVLNWSQGSYVYI